MVLDFAETGKNDDRAAHGHTIAGEIRLSSCKRPPATIAYDNVCDSMVRPTCKNAIGTGECQERTTAVCIFLADSAKFFKSSQKWSSPSSAETVDCIEGTNGRSPRRAAGLPSCVQSQGAGTCTAGGGSTRQRQKGPPTKWPGREALNLADG